MPLPIDIDKAAPADVDNPSAGADSIRDLKDFLESVFGLTDATNYTAAPFAITTAGVVTVKTTPFAPDTSDGSALGSATKMWSDLFLASGAVINFSNGNVTFTHAPGVLTLAGGNLAVTGDLVIDGATLRSYAFASLPTAATAGRLARVTDDVRGVWMDQGTQWFSVQGDVVNVKEFGAKGDGTTNDTAAINAAIAAVDSDYGGVVLFPPGDYATIDQIHVNAKKWVTLAGSGQSLSVSGTNTGTRISKSGAVANPVIRATTAPRLRIRDMTLRHTGVAVAGQHGIQLDSDGSAFGVNAIIERVSIFSTYDGIMSTQDWTSGYMQGIYIRDVVNDGIANTSTYSGVKLDTIYISGPGRHGLNLTAGNSTFIGVITENTGAHGITGSYNRSTFVTPYVGDTVGQRGISWLNSFHNTVLNGNIQSGGANSLIYLDSSYGNIFENIEINASQRYVIETANTSATAADRLLPNIISYRAEGGTPRLGLTNNTTGIVAIERSSIGPEDVAARFAQIFTATQAVADRWSWKARTIAAADYDDVADAAPGANPEPDATERWSFFNLLPGGRLQTETFALAGRNTTNSIFVLPSTETLGSGLITGDASTFAAGIGAWVATGGTFAAAGGVGRFTSTTAVGTARILLSVGALDTAKLYKLTFNLAGVSPMTGQLFSYVRDGAGSTGDLKRLPTNATTQTLSATQVAYFIPETATVEIIVSIQSAAVGDAFDVDNFVLKEVTSAGLLQLSGGRKIGSTAGGGGSIQLYGNEHATKANIVDLVGKIHIPVVATGSLPAAAAAEDGRILIEDAGAGDRNIIIYAGGQRFRLDGGAAF